MWTDGVVALRPWRAGDASALADAWADPEIARWTAVPDDRSEAAAARWIAGWDDRRRQGLALDLAVVAGDDHTAVWGEVGVSFTVVPPSIGWWVAPAVRRQGIATRAVRLFVTSIVPLLGGAEVVADIDLGNAPSLAVARAAGFEPRAPGRLAYRRPPPSPSPS